MAGNNNLQTSRLIASALGGCKPFHLISANTTNATSVKGTPGTVYGWALGNTNASIRYVKLYDKATAPTVGSDTPVATIEVPGNAGGSGNNFTFAPGIQFANGIAMGTTVNPGDGDGTAVGSNDLVINLFYI